MKKISIILACVIISVGMITCPIVVSGRSSVSNTVTAEATEEVSTASAVYTTTEATTEQVEETTVVDTTVTTEKATTRPSTTKQESKTTKKSSTTAKSTTEKTTEKEKETTKKAKEKTTKEKTTKEDATEEDGVYFEGVKLEYSAAYDITSNKLTRSSGVARYGGHRETWYSQKVLPGPGLNISGRHVADDGTVRDGEGYICVAADPSYLSRGSCVMTSLGPGKVYDCGCAYGTVDIYVNW